MIGSLKWIVRRESFSNPFQLRCIALHCSRFSSPRIRPHAEVPKFVATRIVSLCKNLDDRQCGTTIGKALVAVVASKNSLFVQFQRTIEKLQLFRLSSFRGSELIAIIAPTIENSPTDMTSLQKWLL
jgi:hypothetical protein